jgi:hypothetical protein
VECLVIHDDRRKERNIFDISITQAANMMRFEINKHHGRQSKELNRPIKARFSSSFP